MSGPGAATATAAGAPQAAIGPMGGDDAGDRPDIDALLLLAEVAAALRWADAVGADAIARSAWEAPRPEPKAGGGRAAERGVAATSAPAGPSRGVDSIAPGAGAGRLGLQSRRLPSAAAPAPGPAAAAPARAAAASPAAVPAAARTPAPPPAALAGQPAPDAATVLARLRAATERCDRCALHAERGGTLPGRGTAAAKVLVVIEPPAADPSEAAWALLTRMMGAIGLSEADLYVAPLVRCLPAPTPLPEAAVRACSGTFLRWELQALRPRAVLALGWQAGALLTGRQAEEEALRQRHHKVGGVTTIVTWSLRALLERPEVKAAAWQDLRELQRILAEQA